MCSTCTSIENNVFIITCIYVMCSTCTSIGGFYAFKMVFFATIYNNI